MEEVTGASDCADITAAHLASVRNLSIDKANISQLQAHDFQGLTNLVFLDLEDNQLVSLPQGVFSGLSNLEYLGLGTNNLRTLPPGVFRGLDELYHMDLRWNIFRALPEGIFDDVLDSVRAIELDSWLRATPTFALSRQNGHEGETVRARVTLGQALPVAVWIPYTVSGTATSGDYTKLTPDPEAGLLFGAGKTSKEITFTVLKSESGLGKKIVLTLGELSQIKLRRSDGTGEDAPHLGSRRFLFPPVMYDIVHIVTIVGLNVCKRTPQVRDALVEATGVSDCAQVTPSHLSRVEKLDLSGRGISKLHVEDFSGLSSLRVLWLNDNHLNYDFPVGVFDDVLATLEDLRVDPDVRATVSFHSREEKTLAGYSVNIQVKLSEAYFGNPLLNALVMRVPYSVEGTARQEHYSGLPPPSERVLMIPAGSDRQEIAFTVPVDGNRLGKTLVFRLGEVSQIGLSRSDGTGPDAPRLKAETLMNVQADKAVHTVTVVEPVPADICSRTPQVQKQILEQVRLATRFLRIPLEDCSEVTTAHLTRITQLSIANANLTALQEHDFSGLISLENIGLTDNPLTTLPEGIFSGLSNLESLFFPANSLTTLPEGIFQGLPKLRDINLDANSLTELREGIFRGLDNLEYLDYSRNSLSVLPEGIFQGLSRLKTLDSSYNPSLDALPENIFQGLDSLETLWLTSNSLKELPEGIFQGLTSLEVLWLARNGLEELPPRIFRGLDSLEGLFLHRNALRELPEGLFQGLDSLSALTLYFNNLGDLPRGIFDDVLDTLGREYAFGPFAPSVVSR